MLQTLTSLAARYSAPVAVSLFGAAVNAEAPGHPLAVLADGCESEKFFALIGGYPIESDLAARVLRRLPIPLRNPWRNPRHVSAVSPWLFLPRPTESSQQLAAPDAAAAVSSAMRMTSPGRRSAAEEEYWLEIFERVSEVLESEPPEGGAAEWLRQEMEREGIPPFVINFFFGFLSAPEIPRNLTDDLRKKFHGAITSSEAAGLIRRFRALMGLNKSRGEEKPAAEPKHFSPNFVFLSEWDWKLPPNILKGKISRRIVELMANGYEVTPATLAPFVDQGPGVIRITFHNMLMGTGWDEPRRSLPDLKPLLTNIPSKARMQAGEWQRFWETEAEKHLWPKKPFVPAAGCLVANAIAYAPLAGWSILRFAEWLEKVVEEKSDRPFLIRLLPQVIDMEVIEGKRARPRPRLALSELLALMRVQDSSLTEGELKLWLRRFRELANSLAGDNALRKVASPIPL